MPGTTATQGLIYPVGTDRMCEGASQLEILAKGVNGRFTVLDALVDTGEAPQMVLVEFVADQTDYFHTTALLDDNLVSGGIVWNTVSIDSADAFDAGVSSISIKLPYTAPGQLWEVGMYALGRWTQAGTAALIRASAGLIIRDSLGALVHFGDETRLVDSADEEFGASSVTLYETSGQDTFAVAWNVILDANSTDEALQFAQLWAIRVSEV